MKGLYEKAIKGEIKNFTGVSDPYEEPLNADVVVDSEKEELAESVAKVMAKLEALGYVPAARGGTRRTNGIRERAAPSRAAAPGRATLPLHADAISAARRCIAHGRTDTTWQTERNRD